MLGVLEFMAVPFLACIVLIGIHAYYGIHVIERGIIFVDLAMAQIAALGGMLAIFFHRQPNSALGYALSLLATTVGAAVLAYTRHRDQRVPQEAYIGIVYAVASAASVLLANWAPEGTEYVRAMLEGVLLWVPPQDVLLDAAIYAAIGGMHVFLFRRFWRVSTDYEGAITAGLPVRWLDFLFYASFGVVVIFSVRISGVLLVFCFLVIPAVIAALYVDGFARRLIVAYIVGTWLTMIGLMASWVYDTPSGPTVAVVFGLALIAAHLMRPWMCSPAAVHRRLAWTIMLFAVAAVVGVLGWQIRAGTRNGISTAVTPAEKPAQSFVKSDTTIPAEGMAESTAARPVSGNPVEWFRRLVQTTNPDDKARWYARICAVRLAEHDIAAIQQMAPSDWLSRYYWARILAEYGVPIGRETLCRLLQHDAIETARYRMDIVQWLEQHHIHIAYDPLTPRAEDYRRAVATCLQEIRRKGRDEGRKSREEK